MAARCLVFLQQETLSTLFQQLELHWVQLLLLAVMLSCRLLLCWRQGSVIMISAGP
jgi:hypothetical protein